MQECNKLLGDIDNQQRFLHRMKGVSSNLGITSIANVSLQLEKKMQNEKLNNADFESLQEVFTQSYLRFLEEFENQISKEDIPQSETKILLNSAKVGVLNSIRVLSDSFSRGSLDQKEWNTLYDLLSETEFSKVISQIESSIQQFDFENTIKQLNILKLQIMGGYSEN